MSRSVACCHTAASSGAAARTGQCAAHLYFDPPRARRFRGLAAAVAAQAGPDDGILLNAPNQWEVFTYYYKGPLPVYPAPYHPTAEEADTWLATLAEIRHPHLFVLYWGDNESDP
jgi:hypothetical protein